MIRSNTLLVLIAATVSLVACERPHPEARAIDFGAQGEAMNDALPASSDAGGIPRLATPAADYRATPTPEARPEPASDAAISGVHIVSSGDTLSQIAAGYSTTVEAILETNQLANADLLFVGQELTIPGLTPAPEIASDFKIIPDGELVRGPSTRDLDIGRLLAPAAGPLLAFEERVEERLLSGPEIVDLVSHRYSVHPRLLLAALEHRSRWVSGISPVAGDYPMGIEEKPYEGVYWQLGWTAEQLNFGFYATSEGGVTSTTLSDGTRVTFSGQINSGTAGVQYWLAALPDSSAGSWSQESGPAGFYSTYVALFGNPFAYASDPLWPTNLSQPPLDLPWPAGDTWFLTSGPHSGWARGSAWAALDFVPPAERNGCVPTDAWVTASAGGTITRSDFGAVVVDLEDDGHAGTGWAITYMHLEPRERAPVGARVEAGDRLGHPSCEGGFANGTHLHIARTYNGRWVAADGAIPFVLGGWQAQGAGVEYDGFLARGDEVAEACASCRDETNSVAHD